MRRVQRFWTKLSFFLTFMTILPFSTFSHFLMTVGVPGHWVLSHVMTRWVRLMYVIAGVRIRIEGHENLPVTGPYVIVSNHRSLLDFAAVSLLLRNKPVYVMKKELGKIPLFGYLVSRAGTIYLDRKNPDRDLQALEQLENRLREGYTTLIFPEGTRSPDGGLQSFKKGAFHVAIHAGAPIVPLTILNSRELLNPHDVKIRPGTIVFRLHPPIDTRRYSRDTVDELVSRARHRIASALPMEGDMRRQPDARAA